MEIVYTRSKSGTGPGRIARNPRFFDGHIEDGATRVFIVGKWPAIIAAYKAAGIEVEEIGGEPVWKPPKRPAPVPDEIDIPEDWRDLSWQAKRSLAKSLTDVPVINSEQAREVIEAEIERREG